MKWKLGVDRRLLKCWAAVTILWFLIMGSGWIAGQTIWAQEAVFCSAYHQEVLGKCSEAEKQLIEAKRAELRNIGLAMPFVPLLFLPPILFWNLQRKPA
jgi:hypothetical protein